MYYTYTIILLIIIIIIDRYILFTIQLLSAIIVALQYWGKTSALSY